MDKKTKQPDEPADNNNNDDNNDNNAPQRRRDKLKNKIKQAFSPKPKCKRIRLFSLLFINKN